ncbi:MAG TPA: hypothetical protein DDX39_00775 [Bacteroidales bacterium]|nr:MAG: hypothetical protein A2W98_08325 [Bacteroidetes bacterium GWF2_33_38]OFY76720.1 MAG: hypothetical protein A2265_02210 [Bacteroidetes bacterium RIFOXYA12_FULL_33_9]HBF87144.1 hypothetical protein [Bacteroidales bacterium]
MNKKSIGLILGVVAGIIDVTPMIIQGLTWDANFSALSMWIIIGFFIASVDLKINPVLKGILISFLTLIPSSFIIAWHEPISLIPISIMTLVLGSLLGFTIDKFSKKKL